MMYNPRIHHRQSHRLQGYDYSRAGVYFVTLVTQLREHLFGEIHDGSSVPNQFGEIVGASWMWLQERYEHVELDEWILMPDHLHGIIILNDQSDCQRSHSTNRRKALGRLLGAFKTVSTKRINLVREMPGKPVWQRDYHDRIVRNAHELWKIRQYIQENPCRWAASTD